MSSRTAACGQPPVSMARIRDGERALCRVRNSASSLDSFYRVKHGYLHNSSGGHEDGYVFSFLTS